MRSLFLLLLFPFALNVQSQADLESAEDSLLLWQTSIAKASQDDVRILYSDKVSDLLQELFIDPAVMDHPFKKVMESKVMGIIDSPDKAFRIFNWNVPRNDLTHEYICYILIRSEEEDTAPQVVELQQMKKEPSRLEARTLDSDEWLGCLYYEIIPVKKSRKKVDHYVLLGWDGHDRMTRRKFIEAMTISNGKVRFGKAVFKLEKGIQKRMIFEYSAEVSMSCRYQEKKKRIVFDHLAPRAAGLEGSYAFYGPDLTFDALELKKTKWELVENIDVRLDKEKNKRPYNDPRPR